MNLTQLQTADLAGMNYKYFQRFEGNNPPDIRLTTIAKIAKALGTTASKLVG